MRDVDFYKLLRPVQDQLVASTKTTGSAAPGAILRSSSRERRELAWLALSAISAVLLAALYLVGHGDLTSDLAIHPIAAIAAYITLAFAVALGLLRAAAILRDVAVLPYPPGVYVFPAVLVDARRPTMRVWPMADLLSAEAAPDGRSFTLAFPGGTTFVLPLADSEQIDAVERALASAKEWLAQALATHDPRAMAALDPLYDSAFSSPIGPTAPRTRATPAWSRLAWLIALVAGAALGALLFFVRNASSDERMFRRANELRVPAAYREYLTRGSRHQADVVATLLPRAELREAQKVGSVEAVEAYMVAHGGSKIRPEIDAALRTAMLAELEQAKRAGTLAALDAFTRRHPTHGLGPEIQQARHGVYVAALEAYRARAPEKDPALLAFVEKMLAVTEQRGPKVEIRFRRKPSKSLARADAAVSMSRSFIGMSSLPSRHFDEVHARGREQAATKAIAARFAEVFPAEILAIEPGEAIADIEAPLPPVTVPTLFVDHGLEWSGTLYPSKVPRGVFAGAIFSFEGSFRLPDPAVKPLRIRVVDLWRPADLALFKEEAKNAPDRPKPGEEPESKVYEAMGRDAFEQLVKKTSTTFFRALPAREQRPSGNANHSPSNAPSKHE